MLRRAAASLIALTALFAGLLVAFEPRILTLREAGLETSPTTADDEEALKAAITLYNRIFQDLYASGGNPARLNDLPASKQLRHELYRHMGYLGERGIILIYDMASQEFVEIRRPAPAKAEAIVFEEWNYIYRDAATGKIVSSIKGMGEGFRYILEKRQEGWIITDYFPVDMERGVNNEFVY